MPYLSTHNKRFLLATRSFLGLVLLVLMVPPALAHHTDYDTPTHAMTHHEADLVRLLLLKKPTATPPHPTPPTVTPAISTADDSWRATADALAAEATPIPLPGAATMGLFLVGGFTAFYRPKPKHHGRRRR